MLSALLDLISPPACLACRRPPAGLLCPGCRVALSWLGADLCPACALPRPCGRRCPAAALAFSAAWAPLAYAGPARAVVVALKDRGAVPVASLMAAQIVSAVPEALLADATLVPVPADPWRRRRRGVDHTARLAAEVGRRCERPVAGALVRRASRGGRQAGRGRGERLAAGRLPIAVAGRSVPDVAVLVDDVHTTGATLHACALALRAAGAADVRAVTYARTLR